MQKGYSYLHVVLTFAFFLQSAANTTQQIEMNSGKVRVMSFGHMTRPQMELRRTNKNHSPQIKYD